MPDRKFIVQEMIDCPRCTEKGAVSPFCPVCNGKGTIYIPIDLQKVVNYLQEQNKAKEV